MTLGSGLSSLFGGFGKLLKWGCLILVIGFVAIVALLVGVATCTGTDDKSKGSSSQTEVVADTTAVTAQPSEPEPEPMAPEPEVTEVEEQQVEEQTTEPEIAEPKAEEPEVAEPVKEPEPQQQAKPKPRKRTTTQEPKKKKGTGFRLEKVDHIPRPQ
jgi:outer membrane biosynthesis protein TonB